ncbi:MAG: response regulator [Desulfotomaculales bacterium]
MERIRVVIADDHALIREGVRKILSLDPRIHVVGEAADGEEAIALIRQQPVDVVLLDVNMPRKNGIEACRIIKSEYPQISVIALTIHDQEEYLFEMIRAGVAGYVLKDVNPDTLIRTIIGVAHGESFIPPSLATKVFREFRRLAGQPPGTKYPDELTEREVEVLRLVARGESNRSIARILFISEKTVKNHLTNIFQKIGVTDRTQAAVYTIKHKLIDI